MRERRRGTFANGMEYMTWGNGPKSLIFIQGGPGSVLPTGMMARLMERMFAPYLQAGYAVSTVTRCRHMPSGHTVADMADDYADVIRDEFGGRADVVVGESYGGMIAQYLAALHPERVGRVAVVAAGYVVSDWGKDVDGRLVTALTDGSRRDAGTVFAEYLIPGRRMQWLRRLVGPVLLPRLLGADTPREDLLTEIRAECDFDSREVLPRITVPVLLVSGDRDTFFPRHVIEQTAALIPGCRLVVYLGKGHVKTSMSGRVARDVLDFVSRG